MSDRVFPTLPGIVFAGRAPFFVNSTQQADSGRRLVVKKRSQTGFRYTLDVRFLRVPLGEHTTLFEFFASHSGSFESFLFTDPVDSVTRRVRFVDDDLGLTKERGPYYSGEITLETVVF